MAPLRFSSAAGAGLLSTLLPLAAPAAVFTYDSFVFRSPGPAATAADPNFPPIGTPAQVELFVDDSDPSLVIDPFGMPAGFASGKLAVPGYLSTEVVYDPDDSLAFLDLFGTEFAVGDHGPTVLDNPGALTFGPEVRSVTIFFSDIDSLPSTAGELVAAISKPGAHGVFKLRMVDDTAAVGFYDVHVALRPFVIPLPGALVLLGSAFAGFAALRLRCGKPTSS